MRKSISLSRYVVRPVLWLSQFFNDNYFVVVCMGYDEDDLYTGLYWNDDKTINFWTDTEYYDFQLWIQFNTRLMKPFDLSVTVERLETECRLQSDPRIVLSNLLQYQGLEKSICDSIALDWGRGEVNLSELSGYTAITKQERAQIFAIIGLLNYFPVNSNKFNSNSDN